jgi:hypothetical protein
VYSLNSELFTYDDNGNKMGLFNRKKSAAADSGDNKKEKGSWRRPASSYPQTLSADCSSHR